MKTNRQPFEPDVPAPPLVVIECIHGQIYTGPTLDAALARWRADSPHIVARTRIEWMAGIARRTLAWNKMLVRIDTLEHFVTDLTLAGQIVVRRAT